MNRDKYKLLVSEYAQGVVIPIFTINAPNGLIDKICDDFEARTCASCKHLISSECIAIDSWDCYNDEPCYFLPEDNFGCNRYVRR